MNFTSYFKYTTMSLLGIHLYIFCYEYRNIQHIRRKNRLSSCKQKTLSCILYLNNWMWVSFINKVKTQRNKPNFEQKAEKRLNWIQNDNQNVDGVDQHPKVWQSLLPLCWSTFYSITLQCFDAVLCQRIMLNYMWKYLLFLFLLSLCFLVIFYRRCVLVPPTI